MRLLILLVIVLNCSHTFAQKRRKPNKNVFTYSYRLNREDFTRFVSYKVQVKEWNTDSVVINCSPDSAKVSGTISYEYNLISGTTYSSDGHFQVKLSKTELETINLKLSLEFEGYDNTIIDAEFKGIPDEFSVMIEANNIFDEETPYIIINSVYPLTIGRQKEIVNCLSNSKSRTQDCYDEKQINVVIPI